MKSAWVALPGLLALLLWALWDWAGTYPPAYSRIQGIAALAGTAVLVTSVLSREWRRSLDRYRAAPVALGALLLIYVAIQALNPSHALTPRGMGLDPRPYIGFLPHAIDARTAWRSCAWLATCMATVFLAHRAGALYRGRQAVIGVVCVSSSALAVLILCQRILGTRAHVMTGFFVNPNHAAAYLNLSLAPTLFAASHAFVDARRTASRSNPGWLLLGVAALMGAALLLAGSRAALAIAGATLAYWTVHTLSGAMKSAPARRARWTLLIWIVPCAAAVLLLYTVGLNAIEMKDITYIGDLPGRRHLYQALTRTWLDHPIYGKGAGSFSLVFPYYQTEVLRGAFYRHAHCDPLQWLIEVGLAGTGLGAGSVAALLYTLRPRSSAGTPDSDKPRRRADATTVGLAAALAGIAMHSLVEFPLHSAPVALLACAWLGLLTSRTDTRPPTSPAATPTLECRPRHRLRRARPASARPRRR